MYQRLTITITTRTSSKIHHQRFIIPWSPWSRARTKRQRTKQVKQQRTKFSSDLSQSHPWGSSERCRGSPPLPTSPSFDSPSTLLRLTELPRVQSLLSNVVKQSINCVYFWTVNNWHELNYYGPINQIHDHCSFYHPYVSFAHSSFNHSICPSEQKLNWSVLSNFRALFLSW